MEIWQIAVALAVTLFAGFVKGAVGFAMPMIMLSSFASFLPAELALALLILPTLVTNILQASRQGIGAAWGSIRSYRIFIAMIVLFIPISAGFVQTVPQGVMYGLLGGPIVAFALWQLSGKPLILPMHHRRLTEGGLGVIGGLYGGISGIWGPPLIVYLLSIEAPKQEAVRIQGVVFLIGAIILAGAHLVSGVLNAQTIPLSALMVAPALLGQRLGFAAQDRLDPVMFRRLTLILLAIAGANLVRRALMG
ncbi:membrane protein [Thioclava dalianensis]|uniref:Probable membrane transporter protein n=2 Tax=Thioclava dalianensis TaxID=1185766 RepID=A0A074U3H3_9RHOB|nr:membrane protein [Thioclava dalianensis]